MNVDDAARDAGFGDARDLVEYVSSIDLTDRQTRIYFDVWKEVSGRTGARYGARR